MSSSRRLCVALLALAGCGGSEERAREERAPSPPPVSESRVEPSPREDRYASRCSAHEAVRHASGLGAVRGVGLAIGDASQLVVVDREGGLLAIAQGVAPGAAPEPLEMPGTEGLFAVEAIDGDAFVVITRGACPEGDASLRCLAARAVGADGRARTSVATVALPGALRTVRVDASGRDVWIARSSDRAQPALDRLSVGEDAIAVSTRALGEGIDASEEPTEILGLAVSGGSWAALWRHGATEDAESDVMLSTQLDEHAVEALHDALVLESFQWYAGALSVVAAFEFARPRFARIGADGEVRGEVRALPPGEALPQPFATRRSAAIVGSGERLAVEVRDGAGDAIAARVPIEGAFVADVARARDGFVVAYARRDAGAVSIETREVTCARRDAPTQ